MQKTASLRALFALPLLLSACSGGSAKTLEISVSPNRQWYRTGQPIELAALVTNGAGRAVEGAEVTWFVDPPAAATMTGAAAGDPSVQSFQLDLEGRVTITGCLGKKMEGPRCDSVAVLVDDGSPALEVETPEPGGESDGEDGILVRGSVSDSRVMRVFVDGQAVEVDDLGVFETTLEAQFGINHLTVTASDGLTEESSVSMDVLWAPAYAAATGEDGTPHLRLEGGLAVSMGQLLFDDGAPFDPQVTPVLTQDLADILALLVQRMPLEERIPDPVVDQSSFFLRVPTATTGPVESSIDVTEDGIELFIRLPELTLTTEGTLHFDESTLDLEGAVVASVAASATVEVSKAAEEDPLGVDLSNLWLAVETVDGQFVSEETDAVFLLAEGTLRTTIEEQLLGSVEQTLEDGLPALFRQVLEGLDTGLADREFVIENSILPVPITLQIDGRLRTVLSQLGLELMSILRLSAGTTSEALYPDSRGVPLLAPSAPEVPDLFRDRALQVGVRLAFLNSVLHAFWNSQALEIDLGEQLAGNLGGFIESGSISGKMPPVLRPPRPGETDPMVLSLGQLEVNLDLGGGDQATFGVSLDTAIDVAIEENALVVLAPGEPRIRVWTIDASNTQVISEELVQAVLEIQWEDVRDAILGGLVFDLPIPSLGGLGELAPDLAALELSVELIDPVAMRQGYVTLHGELLGTLPAAP